MAEAYTEKSGAASGGTAAGGDDELTSTLVKYNNPVLIIKHADKVADKKVIARQYHQQTAHP